MTQRSLASDRGAVLIQTALAMLVLLGLTVFVVDYGILWLSRLQAQNAADAGAIAGAIALTYDEPGVPVDDGPTEQAASEVARANPVWFEPATPVVNFSCPPDASTTRCVRVEVHRDDTPGSAPIPMLFGPVLGLTTQGVRAVATAEAGVGDGTECFRPFAIPDRWIERNPDVDDWAPDEWFERYGEGGPSGGAVLVPADEYVPPTPGDSGSGFTVTGPQALLGAEVTLTLGNPDIKQDIKPGWTVPLALPGGAAYRDNIAVCNRGRVVLGQQIAAHLGATGATRTELEALIAQDAGATWNAGANRIEGSCAPACAPVSPRLIAIGVFDVDAFQYRRGTGSWSAARGTWPGCPGGSICVGLVNITGLFLVRIEPGGDIVGRLTRYPGRRSTAAPLLPPQSSFLSAPTLVR